MSYAGRLTDAEVRSIANQVLAHEMSALAYESVDVRSANNDDDDMPSLSVIARIGPGISELQGDVFSRIHGALHEALLARGEERFPFLRLRRADDEHNDDAREDLGS